MSTFSEFHGIAPISDEVIARFADRVPTEIVALWRELGAGLIGDGFLRIPDPAEASSWLPLIVDDPEGAVPVFTSALADIVVWQDGYFHNVCTRLDVAFPLSFSKPAHVVRFLEDPGLLERDFRWANYLPAVERLGVPELGECLYYAPLLSLGGPEVPDTLQRGGFAAHLEVAAGFQGRITIGSMD
nr:DUF1851 domain-containing protein [Actinomycetales bacterium]